MIQMNSELKHAQSPPHAFLQKRIYTIYINISLSSDNTRIRNTTTYTHIKFYSIIDTCDFHLHC